MVTYSAVVAASDDRILAGVGSNFDIQERQCYLNQQNWCRDLLVLHDVQLRLSQTSICSEDDYASLT